MEVRVVSNDGKKLRLKMVVYSPEDQKIRDLIERGRFELIGEAKDRPSSIWCEVEINRRL